MKRSPLLPIFLIVVVDILGLAIILPLLPFYAEKFGASPTVVGLLVSTYAFCQLFAGPLLGRISDRTGRKPLLIVSQIGTLAGFVLLARAETLWVVFLARAVDGLTAGNLSLAQAYIADVTAPKDRSKSFAVIGIAFGIGFLVGPGISGFLAQYGYTYPIWLAAGLSFTSIMATTFLLPRTPPAPEGEVPADAPVAPAGRKLSIVDWGSYVGYFQRKRLGPLLWQFFAYVFSFSTFTGGFALFAERRFSFHGHPFGAKEVGYVLAYSGFLGILWQGGLIGRLVKRFGEPPLVAVGFLAAAVAYALLGVSTTLVLLVISATVSSFGNGVLRPVLTSLVTQEVGRNEQGVVLGLTQSLQSVAAILAPALAGALISRGWLAQWALVASAALAIGFAVSRSTRVEARPESA